MENEEVAEVTLEAEAESPVEEGILEEVGAVVGSIADKLAEALIGHDANHAVQGLALVLKKVLHDFHLDNIEDVFNKVKQEIFGK